MLATLIPLFDNSMAVCAYSIFAQRENYFLNPSLLGAGGLDAASSIPGLDIINSIGLGTLAENNEVFIEVNNISLFSDIEHMCEAQADKLVLLMDYKINPEPMYVNRVRELKEKGFRFAIRKLKIEQFEEYKPVLNLMDYILLDHKKIKIDKARIYFGQVYPHVKLCAVNVDSKEDYERLVGNGGYYLYEGDFFRTPVISGKTEVSPLKANYIELLNIVNDKDFDLSKAADIISRDTALVINLLEVVNRMSRNSEITSVRNAAAMLGQKELKRWINTVVTKSLCADKPNEITRLSLIRAKFAESLAPLFGIKIFSPELFLMGLFSVLDIILDKPMEEALKMVKVSRQINDALLLGRGELSPVLSFLINYGDANWQAVSRTMLIFNIDTEDVYKAYLSSLMWYRDMFL